MTEMLKDADVVQRDLYNPALKPQCRHIHKILSWRQLATAKQTRVCHENLRTRWEPLGSVEQVIGHRYHGWDSQSGPP